MITVITNINRINCLLHFYRVLGMSEDIASFLALKEVSLYTIYSNHLYCSRLFMISVNCRKFCINNSYTYSIYNQFLIEKCRRRNLKCKSLICILGVAQHFWKFVDIPRQCRCFDYLFLFALDCVWRNV